MIFPLQDYWSQLREGTRDQIVGGLILAAILALATIFRKFILRGLRSLLSVADPQPAFQAGPQPLILKVETVPPPPPQIQAAPAPATDRPVVKSHIPRPPLAGFVARRDGSGREIVERLKEELSPEKEQLIVLWGAGGVGKTTLAAETARAMRDVFDGGIVWTSADGKPEYSLSTLLDDIATHLGRPDLRQLLPEQKGEAVSDALSKASDALVILDNFETIAPEQQKQCAEWLAHRASCPALITSRDEVAHARPVHILAMSLSEAREFLSRLISEAHNRTAFEALDQEQIINAADRIPLVLQWVVKQIDSAKEPRTVLDELLHGEGEAAQRVFDSFDLTQVGNDGRAVLLALSLFVPSASRVALAEVAGFGKETERLDRAVQQLAELWLIQTTERNERLRVEGLTRELTKARLEKDQTAAAYKQRFVLHFRNYAAPRMQPTAQNYNELEAEKDNLLNAMDLSSELADWQSLYALAYVIAYPVDGMLTVRGYWTEALKSNQQALAAARRANAQAEVANFAHNSAVMSEKRGDLEEAQQLYRESLEIVRELKDESGIAIRLHELARLAHNRGELTEARKLYNESLEIKKKLDDQNAIANTLHQLGWLSHEQGELAEAQRLYEESLGIRRKLENERGIALSLHQMAMLAHDKGELAKARELYAESLEIATRLGDQGSIALSLGSLGMLEEDEGDLTEATRLYTEALEIFERLKSPNTTVVQDLLNRVKGKIGSK